MEPLTPWQLGFSSHGQDVECPFGQFDQDTAAWDEWHEGRDAAELDAGERWADVQDPSMRDLYEP